ncbi:hypothetical protein AB6A40_002696 [Gnathostoma spinigerum]|uniref:Uncharacterized protein n=1 Tax=Gnathostoma spinigerum TaxID=75299 RepID=A0ABD6E9K4_9BILA
MSNCFAQFNAILMLHEINHSDSLSGASVSAWWPGIPGPSVSGDRGCTATSLFSSPNTHWKSLSQNVLVHQVQVRHLIVWIAHPKEDFKHVHELTMRKYVLHIFVMFAD